MTRQTKFLQNAGLLASLVLTGNLTLHAQPVNYATQLNQLYTQVQKDFYIPDSTYYREHAVKQAGDHEVSFLWPLCALIQADNEMEKLNPGKSYMQQTYAVIEKYNDDAPPAPGYDSYPGEFSREDRYYDDNQWIGIAAMDAYFREKRESDLAMGEKIHQFMMTGYDSVSGGGLYWREGDKNTKNTCSNGPAVILLMQLFQATNKKSYLNEAIAVYNWTNKQLRSPEHLFYDNLNVKTGAISKHFFSYNAGTMLQSNVYLYEATKDNTYLKEAIQIAQSATKYFLGSGHFRDDYWFNAVFLRGLQHLYKHNKDNQYLKAFQACTDYALANDMNGAGLMGKKKTENLVGQGGMLEILARLAWLQKKGVL